MKAFCVEIQCEYCAKIKTELPSHIVKKWMERGKLTEFDYVLHIFRKSTYLFNYLKFIGKVTKNRKCVGCGGDVNVEIYPEVQVVPCDIRSLQRRIQAL